VDVIIGLGSDEGVELALEKLLKLSVLLKILKGAVTGVLC
jgi:hypothetical protein